MNTPRQSVVAAMRAALLMTLLVGGGSAIASTYNFILKTSPGGAGQGCATGGFTFTKTTIGTFATTSPSVTLTGTAATPCFGADNTRTLSTGTLNVTVANVTLNNQDQGPNVVSVAGALSSGNGSNNWTITFLANKTFTVTRNTGQNQVVGSGTYYLYNTANAVPEPKT